MLTDVVAQQDLDQGRRAAPFAPPREPPQRLLDASAPVIGRLERELEDAALAVILTDEHGRVADRRGSDAELLRRLDTALVAPGCNADIEHVGTTALAMALMDRAPAVIVGGEHSSAALKTIATAAAPIIDRGTGQLQGAVMLVWNADPTGSLILYIARQAAREIEQRLADGRSAHDRVLREAFLHARRHARGPLVLVSDTLMLRNARAARLFDDADRPSLWAAASDAAESDNTDAMRFTTRTGSTVVATVTAIREEGTVVGALVQGTPARTSPTRSWPARIGWEGLTESERAIADLTAQGLTNREIGTRLYMSHHTVDSHLRSIFRKLDITSRAALAAVVAGRAMDPANDELIFSA